MIKRYFYPKISQSIFLLVISFILQILVGIITAIPSIILNKPMNTSSMILLISSFTTLLTAVFGIYRSKVPVKNIFRFKAGNKLIFILVPLFFLGVYSFNIILSGILENFIPSDVGLEKTFTDGFQSFMGVFSVVILAPIFEELLFRGIILRGFLKNYSVIKSLVISSLLFGIIHFNPLQSINAFVAGLALGFVYIKTGTLWMSILFHALNNGLSALLYYVSVRYGPSDALLFSIIIPCMILGAGALYFLIRTPNDISYIIKEKEDELNRYEAEEARILYEYQSNYQNIMAFTPPLKHSGLGIASFIISIAAGLSNIISFIAMVAFMIVSRVESSVPAIIFSLILILGTFMGMIGLCLGIGGALSKNRKKIFSILGIAFNSVIILFFILIMVIGIVAMNILPIRGFSL